MVMRVLPEFETMVRVADGNLSMARFGRCELRLMQGHHALAQSRNPSIQRWLRRVMGRTVPGLCVCVPRIFEGMPPGKRQWYGEFTDPAVKKDLFRDRLYGSTFVTRRDAWVDMLDEDLYWKMVRGIWQNRPVLLVAGSDKGLQAKESGFLGTAASVQVLQSVARDAWDDRERIQDECVRWADIAPKQEPLVYLSLGATATVLAYDLTALGIQALDMGHCSQSWSRTGKQARMAGEAAEIEIQVGTAT